MPLLRPRVGRARPRRAPGSGPSAPARGLAAAGFLAAAAAFLGAAATAFLGGAAAVAEPLPAIRGGPRDDPRGEGFGAFAKAASELGGVEGAIEEAYRQCFRSYIVDGRVVTIRMPFGQNHERSELAEGDFAISGGGKADPAASWRAVDALLAGDDFQAYQAALSDGREKLVIFDIEKRSWSTSRDLFYMSSLKAGRYPGLPHKPYVLVSGDGIDPADIYNYIYCVGRIGMDCSGFVWHALKNVGRKGGLDLDRTAGRTIGTPPWARTALYIGTWFFDPRNKALEEVEDRIDRIRPGDVIVFRTEDGETVHSAVIQSIDRTAGRIRYLQSTDEAPRAERGVHESFIEFDPARPDASLKDPSLRWSQKRAAAFEGEALGPYRDDGERYRAHPDRYGGTVVRLKALKAPMPRLRAGGK